MTKHEADVIGGLNMTDQISNEAYKQIMIAAQEENEVGDVLNKIELEIKAMFPPSGSWMYEEGHEVEHTVCEVLVDVLQIIDKYRNEVSE